MLFHQYNSLNLLLVMLYLTQVTERLRAHGFAQATIMWLLSNLKPTPAPAAGAVGRECGEGVESGVKKRKGPRLLEWRFDIETSRALITDASRVDSLPLLTTRFRPDQQVTGM